MSKKPRVSILIPSIAGLLVLLVSAAPAADTSTVPCEPSVAGEAQVLKPADPAAVARELEMASKGIGGTSPLVIPAAAFASKGNSAGSSYFQMFSGYLQGSSLAGGCVQAPVYLPQGVEIVSLYASLYDNDPTNNVYVTLTRASNGGYHDSNDMAWLNSTGCDIISW